MYFTSDYIPIKVRSDQYISSFWRVVATVELTAGGKGEQITGELKAETVTVSLQPDF